jgi:hypothetical protein
LQEIDRRKRIGESIENYRYSFTKWSTVIKMQ